MTAGTNKSKMGVMDKGEIMKRDWINWRGGDCPVRDDLHVEVKLRDGACVVEEAKYFRWSDEGYDWDIVAYRPHEPSEQSEQDYAETPDGETPKEERPHNHYHKDVSKYSSIDVYRVLDLFGVTDQAIGHAAKKLLVAGGRGLKDIDRDIDDVIDTLNRWKEMRKEDIGND